VNPRSDIARDLTLARMLCLLVEAYRPDAVYLYGPRARGRVATGAHYHLLVIVPDSPLPLRERCEQAYLLLCEVDATKEIVVLTRAEAEQKRKEASSLPAMVLREGELLYAA